VRKKEAFASALDNIPGIGYGRKRSLLNRFGSVRAIQKTSVEELAATRGINKGLARKIKEFL
jgi:excinuclease ABC subunit C